jgi:hypothetical protein
MQTYRVSHVAAFARWRDDEDAEGVDWLINQIISNEETEPMRRGTAFHKALETIKDGWEGTEIESMGYRFVFTCDVAISLPPTRELRKDKDYGGIIVSGQADGIGGGSIIDHKTTSRFDAEKYIEGWQWRFYLDIFAADQFTWFAWEMKEIDAKVYEVFGFHQLTQYRYPGLEQDCRELVSDFKRFAERYLGSYSFAPMEPKCAPQPKPEFRMWATRGTNLIAVGYQDGVLRCAFAAKRGATFYRFPGAPEFIKDDLIKNPYPDKRWAYLKKKYDLKGEAEAA